MLEKLLLEREGAECGQTQWVVTLEPSLLSSEACQADTHPDKETHTERQRDAGSESQRRQVRGREKKQKHLEKEQEWLWGKTLVADGQEVETEAHPPEPRNLWSL